MERPNKGHFGDNINSDVLFFVERLSSFGGLKCIRTIGKQIFGTLACVLCREVYYIVSTSLYWRVHYRTSSTVLHNLINFAHVMSKRRDLLGC